MKKLCIVVFSVSLLTRIDVAAQSKTRIDSRSLAMAPGALMTYSYKLDGDTLWLTQQRNWNGPITNPVTVRAVRVE